MHIHKYWIPGALFPVLMHLGTRYETISDVIHTVLIGKDVFVSFPTGCGTFIVSASNCALSFVVFCFTRYVFVVMESND